MSIPSPAFARYRLQWLLLGLGLLLLLLALQHAFRQVTEINKRDTINAATQLSSQHQRMETFLEAMRGQAEERLRSNPQSVLSRQLYQALQSGVVDGADVTLSNVYTQKLYEVQKYVTLLHHSHQAYAVVVNRQFWEGLPKDLRDTLESAMADATTYANGLTLAEERNAYDKIKAAGKAVLIELTPAERDAIRAVMVQTHKDMEGRLGRDTMQALYKATEFNVGKR